MVSYRPDQVPLFQPRVDLTGRGHVKRQGLFDKQMCAGCNAVQLDLTVSKRGRAHEDGVERLRIEHLLMFGVGLGAVLLSCGFGARFIRVAKGRQLDALFLG